MIKDLLTICAVFTSGILGAAVVFVLFDVKTSLAEHDDRDIPYENYYLLGNTKEDIIKYEKQENIDKGVVEEETPDGKAILKYNKDATRFDYWSEKNIEYKYLEVLARKYVIIYDCKELYINIFKELVKAWEIVEKNKKDLDVVDDKKDDVFVTLKNYKLNNTDDKNSKIVNEKANVYKRIGTYDEFFVVKKEVKKINYKTFMNSLLPSSLANQDNQ
jgi:hypothetical protein